MFDSSNKGWLAKLIEEVEEDIVEEEEVEVVAAIVESKLVEIVFSSDTMKRIELRLRLKQTRIQNHKKTESDKRVRNREKKRESSKIFCKCLLNWFALQLSLFIHRTNCNYLINQPWNHGMDPG